MSAQSDSRDEDSILAGRKQAFVAYPGRDQALADLSMGAVQRANAVPIQIHYEPWPFNDIAGTPLISPIIEKIDEAPFVVADITFLNENVVYEIGYAVGKRKRVFLIRHKGTDGDKPLAKAVGIFDTLGYKEYEDVEDLKNILTAHIEERPIEFSIALDQKSRVFVIEPNERGPDVGMMVSAIKRAGYGRYQSFTPDEDARLAAPDAIRWVAAASGVFIPLQLGDSIDVKAHNIRSMFVAGLSDGMGKPTLLLAPHDMDVPLDVRDDATRWRRDVDIARAVGEFCPQIVEYATTVEPSGIDRTTLLQSLRIGDPRAENEMTTLENYYLDIDQYDRAVRGEVNLVVGRKGSGKTALFIRVRDRIRKDRRNVVLDLKPEGYQLIKMKEDILEFLSEGARQHLITAFWEYLLYLEVAYKLLEKDRKTYRHDHESYRLKLVTA